MSNAVVVQNKCNSSLQKCQQLRQTIIDHRSSMDFLFYKLCAQIISVCPRTFCPLRLNRINPALPYMNPWLYVGSLEHANRIPECDNGQRAEAKSKENAATTTANGNEQRETKRHPPHVLPSIQVKRNKCHDYFAAGVKIICY